MAAPEVRLEAACEHSDPIQGEEKNHGIKESDQEAQQGQQGRSNEDDEGMAPIELPIEAGLTTLTAASARVTGE